MKKNNYVENLLNGAKNVVKKFVEENYKMVAENVEAYGFFEDNGDYVESWEYTINFLAENDEECCIEAIYRKRNGENCKSLYVFEDEKYVKYYDYFVELYDDLQDM